MKPHRPLGEYERPVQSPRSDARIGLAAADVILAARHARGLERFLAELGRRGEAVAARHVAERLDRAVRTLARG